MRNFLRLFAASFFILVVAGLLHAQPNFWLGVHAGVDLGIFTFQPDLPSRETESLKLGLLQGIEAEYRFSNIFAVSAGIEYVQKGTTDKEGTFPFKFTNTYVQIPLLLKGIFGSAPLQAFFFAGPEIGFKISGKVSGVGNNGKDTTIDFDSAWTSTNTGILAGAGISYALNSTTQLFLEAAYDYGLTNIFTLGNEPDAGVQKIFTRDIRITVGVLFALDKPASTQ